MSKAPERIWAEPGMPGYLDEPNGLYTVEYVRADRIEELEAENKRLNEQMDAIEEMGTESLNALPDCLMRLAPALVENDDLKAKLAKAVEALDEAVYLLAPDDKDMARKAGVYRIVTTLAELGKD